MIHKNPLAPKWTQQQKQNAYNNACKSNALAYKPDGSNLQAVPLSQCDIQNVEFIGGAWRIQRYTDYDLFRIGKDIFILGEPLPAQGDFIEYYKLAPEPTYNCYGPLNIRYELVAAKMTTKDKVYWAYGKNMDEAHSYLIACMFNENSNKILSVLGAQRASRLPAK